MLENSTSLEECGMLVQAQYPLVVILNQGALLSTVRKIWPFEQYNMEKIRGSKEDGCIRDIKEKMGSHYW